YGRGVVFELSPMGASWTETVLYSPAKGQVGSYPQTGLIMDPAGNLYGATLGDVFELSPSDGGWTARKICGVAAHDYIVAGLTMDAAGNIFGNSQATVFELTPNGKGGWLKHVLHKFAGSPNDGAAAEGIPVLDQAGNIYGTTEAGGLDGYGTVYEVSPEKHGKWTEKILYSFEGGTSDGYSPFGGIVFDAAGNIYGTTGFGGASGDGIVYELLAPVGAGSYSEQVLWSFNGTDGQSPYGTLILDSAGNLYGTTYFGGSTLQGGCLGDGCGVVFEVTQ
ncbi:MAG: choice-of-anchor tandem repeat GloVer-containing protein, partial [Terriglobales bacterium]